MKSEESMYRFIEEKQIEKIVLEYILNNNHMEDRCIDVLKVAFDQMVSRILLQIKLYIENINQLKKTENLYHVIQEVKKRYETYLDQSLEHIGNPEILEIIKMIFDVLEMQKDDFSVERENPLEYERTLIESLALLKAQDALNHLKDESIREFTLPISIYNEYKDILKDFILNAYYTMQDDLKIIVEKHAREINIYESRSELINYIKVINEQKTILESFIHIDLNIDSDRFNEKANQLTSEFVYPLRDTYQYICSTIDDVEHAIKKCEKVEYNFVVKNIESIIENNIMNNSKLIALMEVVEANKKNTLDLFLMHVNDELVKVSTKAVNNLKRVSHPFELINYSLIDHMSTILMDVQALNINQVEEEHHRNIIQGVIDTLMLKYDVIKEKNEDYQLERKANQLDVTNIIFDFREEFEKNCNTYFEEAIQGTSSGFEHVQDRFDKVIHQAIDQAYERELTHLNKDILFEIKSLEDIIHQSIAILMENEQELVQSFGKKVRRLFELMIEDLKKYQVDRIFPEPGEKFNGRMHEIILVEESRDYIKGEIIRTQNSGFAIKGRIITRASIVAAK
jgi:molecular chaperone GrpE (heat shock protein)